MPLIIRHFGRRTALFGALAALALGAGTAPRPAAADALRGYASPSGVRVDYGHELKADVRLPLAPPAPKAAPLAAAPEPAAQAPRRGGITIHRAGLWHGSNIKVHRGGGAEGAKVIIHRAGIDRAAQGRHSRVRIHRMGEARGVNLRIHRAREPRAVHLRIHRAGTRGDSRS